MKEERDDVQFVCEFYEISKKYLILKDLYLKNKDCLRLMKVIFNFDLKCFEGMDYLGNVNVEIIKIFYIERCMFLLSLFVYYIRKCKS